MIDPILRCEYCFSKVLKGSCPCGQYYTLPSGATNTAANMPSWQDMQEAEKVFKSSKH